MDNIIERAVWTVHDGDADVITTTITRKDNTKEHYYIYKVKNENKEEKQVPIPLWVFSKINGKGRNNRFIVVAIFNEYYVEINLNKEHVVIPDKEGNMCIAFKEAEEIERFDDDKFHVPLEESDIFDNLTTYQIERIMIRLKYELEEIEKGEKEKNNTEELPF